MGRKNLASSSSPLDFCGCLPPAGSSQKPATWEPDDLARSRGEKGEADEEQPWGGGTPVALFLEHGNSIATLRPWGRRQRSGLLGLVDCFHSSGEESLSSPLTLLVFGGVCPLKHPALCSPLESHVLVSVCTPPVPLLPVSGFPSP